jgi:hypothetical protein
VDSSVTNTLAVVASENRKFEGSVWCSLSGRQRINLRGWLTELRNSEGSVESRNQFSGERRRCHTEETKLKLMCCKIVKRLTVVPPGEYSNKPELTNYLSRYQVTRDNVITWTFLFWWLLFYFK